MKTAIRNAALLIALVVCAGLAPARADVTAEALLKVLVRKGVLTQQEAEAVKAEAEAGSAATKPVPTETAPNPRPATAPKTEMSGYVQFRATTQKHVRPSTQFMDRRARLTVRNTSDNGRLVVTLEGAPTAVSLYDGYYDLYLGKGAPGVARPIVRLGQFMKPFGLEFERPTADYEFPELPAGWTALFPGYRDVGGFVSYGFDPYTRADLGIVNGNGAGSINLTCRDNDNAKDIVARVRRTVSGVGEFALSAYRGKATSIGTNGAPNITGDRNRLGVGATIRNVAGGEFRTEYIAARDLTANLGAGTRVATADAMAWYAMYIRPVASKTQVGIRYDQWDPDTHNVYRLNGDGEIRTLGIVGIHQLNDQTKLSLALERPRITAYNATTKVGASRNDDLLTFQGQYRF